MRKYIWFYLTAMLLMACGGDETPGEEPIVRKYYISVSPNLQLLGDGQETELRISANCAWTISNNADWLTVSPSTGTNSETVRVSAGKNSTGHERTATLTITGENAPSRTVLVTQPKGSEEPVTKTLSTNINSLNFEAKGETKSFSITSNTNWTISYPDWCLLSKSSGADNDEISITALENTSKYERSGQIVVSGEGVSPITIVVTQKEKVTENSDIPGADDNTPPT